MESFTKHRPDAPDGFFEVEAAGLRWLAEAGGVRVAEVLEVTPDTLTIERVPIGRPSPAAAAAFGEQLVRTHDAGAAAFGAGPKGWTGDGFIGSAPLSLRPAPRWGEFFAAQRVLAYAVAAERTGALSASGRRLVERVCERLASGEFDDDAPPARIHGDLWSGNVLWSGDGVVLIDPAAHGGHRLSDLAMLALFGAPQLPVVFDAYQAASGQLPDDWKELIGLHQLHPVLVHAVLFGGGYGEQAAALARRYA